MNATHAETSKRVIVPLPPLAEAPQKLPERFKALFARHPELHDVYLRKVLSSNDLDHSKKIALVTPWELGLRRRSKIFEIVAIKSFDLGCCGDMAPFRFAMGLACIWNGLPPKHKHAPFLMPVIAKGDGLSPKAFRVTFHHPEVPSQIELVDIDAYLVDPHESVAFELLAV